MENVRKYLEISLSNEAQVMQEKAQALMEAEVDQLQEKIEAESLIRNEENNRLCKALHHLKVQVQQVLPRFYFAT